MVIKVCGKVCDKVVIKVCDKVCDKGVNWYLLTFSSVVITTCVNWNVQLGVWPIA